MQPGLNITLVADPQLVHTAGANGVERSDLTNGNSHGINHTKLRESKANSEDAIQDEDESSDGLVSFDELDVDADTMVSRRSLDELSRPSGPNGDSDPSFAIRRQSAPQSNPDLKQRINSIQIRLEKTDRKGRYILTADDPEIKDILRKAIEREQIEREGKRVRSTFRDLLFTPRFTTFDRQNPSASESPFFGFFTLFWIAMVLLFVQVSMHNYREHGSILGTNQMMKMMFSHDVWLLGVTDAVMCAATMETFYFQLLIQKGWLRWDGGGWIVQNIWQSFYLAAVIGWTYFREWPWTHTIFLVLHGLVFLMKQHSYASYNGYLSSVYRRRSLLEVKLKQLEQMEANASAPNSPAFARQNSSHSNTGDTNELSPPIGSTSSQRRTSLKPWSRDSLDNEESAVASVARAVESGNPMDLDQMQTFENIIKTEITDLTKELQGKSSAESNNAYPNNLTIRNFLDYICLPTLVYELEYPRQERTNWWYVLEKVTATFGVLCVMMVISQAFIYPAVAKTVAMKEAGMPIEQCWQEFPFIVSDMLFPLLIEQLLTWYLIWECILNVLAEVTCFADRGFYGDWWNSVTWDQYARDWNRPVHNFLLRHVYHSSISTFHLSRNAATFATFLLSALVHEMCMAVMFKKVRGYLFWMQLAQMPLISLSRSKLMKGRTVLGNVIFWIGLFVGPSILTSLYLVM